MPSPCETLSHPQRLPLVFASILAADFGRMETECASALEGGADGLHLDVMDGHFVPNLTMGPEMARALRRHFPKAFLDVHLMVTEPDKFIGPFREAGADSISFHIEALSGDGARKLLGRIRKEGAAAGIALNPSTPAQALGQTLEDADFALVMSVNPGYAGQAFMSQVLPKAGTIRGLLKPTQRLQMDGGLNRTTTAGAIAAGADLIVAASAIFGARDRKAEIAALRRK